MRLIIVGPGRAGLSLGLALRHSHHLVGVVARSPQAAESAGRLLGTVAIGFDTELPPADLIVVAVRDDAIISVAERLAAGAAAVAGAIHLSGLTPVAALEPLARAGLDTGSLHPLQTFPTPEAGMTRIRGAWFAVTAAEPLRSRLRGLTESIGGRPFDLEDGARALYHAAAAAAANFPIGSLALAEDLFAAAGVPFAAARPLVEAVVANAFDLGPRQALTGPVARGDVGTVAAQMHAVREALPDDAADYAASVDRLARIVGNRSSFNSVLE